MKAGYEGESEGEGKGECEGESESEGDVVMLKKSLWKKQFMET